MNEAAVSRYNFRESEAKWQQHWEQRGVFTATEIPGKPKYYVLEMFPYPSGNIHMGHVRNYTLGDVVARFKRAQGLNVLHPMGWDAFGLPAENAAIERGSHPAQWTLANIATMREQLKSIGLSYDWSREVATCLPEYYRHEQAFFLHMLKAGIAYRKESYVNWDPVDHTVLANEQVIEGRGWRSGAPVERRKLSQWFLRISAFADDLLSGLEGLNQWPEKVRLMQERWIGKSQGATLKLRVEGRGTRVEWESLEIYTTRPETLFGMSFCAIAPNHPLALSLAENNSDMAAFIAECNALGTSEEVIEKAEKKGFNTGLTITHPFEKRSVPLFIANFVLMDYGTGAIFACPAHDQRDFEFASKYNLPILPVVSGYDQTAMTEAYTGDGVMVNSGFLDGMAVDEARKAAIAQLEKLGAGTAKTNYRLRDWGVSRQRYWGCPIPVIHCDECGVVPVPEQDLPVTLPEDVTFDQPGNPLERHPTWQQVNCPACGKAARRETDTFDTFFESSWYFARFTTMPGTEPLAPAPLNYWMEVDCYIGGIEHAVLHLLYSRFFSRALKQCGLVNYAEPFKRLETQGMICHETYKGADGKWLQPDEITKQPDGSAVHAKTGEKVQVGRIEKMSKSKKNTVDPRYIIETYGADAARLFMLSDSPPERDLEWTDAGIEGAWRYINRLWRLLQSHRSAICALGGAMPPVTEDSLVAMRRTVHKTIKAVSADIEAFHFNKAVARLREMSNALEDVKPASDQALWVLKEGLEALVIMLNPFMPHLAEELWQQLGHSAALTETPWPVYDDALAKDDRVTIAVQVNGKLRATVEVGRDADSKQVEAMVLDLAAMREALSGKAVQKVIVVPNRIVNVVAK